MTAEDSMSPRTCQMLFDSIDRMDRLHKLTNDEIADLMLTEVIANLPAFSLESDIAEEVVERLRVWDESPDAIRERWDRRVAREEAAIRNDADWNRRLDERVNALLGRTQETPR